MCSLCFVYSDRNRVDDYLSLLGGDFFCTLCIFYEHIGRIGELIDLDWGLGPQYPQFLEAPMVEEEQEVCDEIMKNEDAVLAEAFMQNQVTNALGGNNTDPRMFDVFYEDVIGTDDEDVDLFHLL